PLSVITRVKVDHVVPPQELPTLLARLANSPAGTSTEPDSALRKLEGTEPGTAAELVCPICQGVLAEAQTGLFQHFRCHVGHTFSLETLVGEQSEAMDRALWAAVRTLEESSALSRRLSTSGTGEMKQRFGEKAQTQTQQAQLIRELLLH